jgi:DNA-binding CsgD family transcriptional regulator
MTWHPGLGQRVFRWIESTRQILLRSCPQAVGDVTEGADGSMEVADDGAEAAALMAAVAEREGDEELLLSMMLAAGRLEEAEALLSEKIWDLLPNAMAPLWFPLMQRSPLELVEHPALLAARLRLGPHRARSPVSLRAARAAPAQQRRRGEQIAPWTRCGELAHALHLALYAEDREEMIEVYTRARALIEDLVGSEAIEDAGGREVSELMFLADTVFRSGNTIPAAEIARFVMRVIEVDPPRLDPCGERRDAARRLILHDHRARGLEDVLDASVLLAGIQFLHHDGDIVVAAMTLMWQAMDDGEFEAADGHLRSAAERIGDPGSWPILQLMRAHLAVHRRATEEIQTYVSAFERSTLAAPGPFAQGAHSQIQRLADHLSRHAGRPVPSPGFLPVSPAPGALFYPRTEFTVHLMQALYAVREGRLPEVRAALGKAAALSPRRELGLYTLAHATQDEVEALRRIAEDVPGGERLRLEQAVRIAGVLDAPTLEISPREREVLGHLRRGATNPEMAEAMFVSVNTVKFHRANLMRKLGASHREELLAAAAVRGL